MAHIGEEKRIYEVPEPVSVPDTVPADAPSVPAQEPEKVPA